MRSEKWEKNRDKITSEMKSKKEIKIVIDKYKINMNHHWHLIGELERENNEWEQLEWRETVKEWMKTKFPKLNKNFKGYERQNTKNTSAIIK